MAETRQLYPGGNTRSGKGQLLNDEGSILVFADTRRLANIDNGLIGVILSTSFMPQCDDGVETGRFPGRVDAEKQPYCQRQPER